MKDFAQRISFYILMRWITYGSLIRSFRALQRQPTTLMGMTSLVIWNHPMQKCRKPPNGDGSYSQEANNKVNLDKAIESILKTTKHFNGNDVSRYVEG